MRFASILLLTASTMGCIAEEGDESFAIVNNLVPMIDPASGAATFTPNATGPFFSSLVIGFGDDTALVGSLFESRVQATEGRESLRTISIEGANISLEIGDTIIEREDFTVETIPTAGTAQFQVAFSASLPPNGGLAVGIYDVIPFAIMAELRSAVGGDLLDPNVSIRLEVLTTTTAFGDFYGDRIDATSFLFPVTLQKKRTCGDLSCDLIFGEDLTTCPFDCTCGNGVCDTAREETTETCPVDCPAP